MKRRDFLKYLSASPWVSRVAGIGAGLTFVSNAAHAAEGKTLVLIFQQGGCDGLNMVVPYQEDEYYRLRPDIAIQPPGSATAAALDLDGFFGFHPQLGGLYEIYQQGDLAVLPAVHYQNGNRSHFSSQDFIESGVPNQRLEDGWINRYLSLTPQNNDLRALSFDSMQHALRGDVPVMTLKSLSFDGDFDATSRAVLEQVVQGFPTTNHSRSLLQRNGLLALSSITSISPFSDSSYTPANGAIYPDTLYGHQLKDVARLIKAGVGLEVAAVSNENWDDHANQGGDVGNQASRLAEFSAGIAALYRDLGSAMADVVILTLTEFGRTVEQNASQGTDHGNAASWMVIGGSVNGGIYGEWPGLYPEQLYLQRYLAHTIEFTDIYAEILTHHLGVSNGLSHILPGSTYHPVGFLS